jgi:hypothetical protein
MAEFKISELAGADPLAGTEVVPLVQNSQTRIRTVASLVAEGGLTDHENAADPHSQYMQEANNLSDVGNVSTARSNLDVYSRAESDSNYLNESDNLFDLPDKATARTNLDVYSKSESDSNYLNESDNLFDLPDKATARTNLDVYSKSESDNRYLDEASNLSDVADAPAAFSNIKQSATETISGVVEKATGQETEDGVADKYPDAESVKNFRKAIYTDYDDSSSQLGVTNTQDAIDTLAGTTADVIWGTSSDSFSRKTYNSGVTPVHEGMRRCVLNSNGTVNYYLHSDDSTLKADGSPANLDGTDGQVMVEVPKFYVRVATAAYGKVIREISEVPRSGFVLHPAFAKGGTLQYDSVVGMWHYVGHTGERAAFYIGAYQASVYDSSAVSYIDGLNLDDNSGRIDTANDLLSSVSGYYPMVGVTRSGFRSMASNRGSGWSQWLFWQLQAVKLLFFVEYGGFNSQALLANGNVNVGEYPPSSSNQTESPHSIAGKSNSIGNGSGGVDSTSRDTAWMSYRGIENLWGNAWQWCDGWNIDDYVWYVTNDTASLADDTTTGYVQLGVQAPTSNGYIRNVQHETLGDVVSDSTGSSSSAFADYYYQGTGWRAARVGGGANYGATAGVSCGRFSNSSANAARLISARVAFSET